MRTHFSLALAASSGTIAPTWEDLVGDDLERAIAGALRATIRDHGPITPENIGSAVKRIAGNLRNAKITGLAREMARRRWADTSEGERRDQMADAARSRWRTMTKAERSAEMSRRRKLGAQRKKEKGSP